MQEAFALNEPLSGVKGSSGLAFDSFLSFDIDAVEPDAVKKAEDGSCIVIRFHEFAGSRQTVSMQLGFTYTSWCECDLRERPFAAEKETKITMQLKPYEIKTILVNL